MYVTSERKEYMRYMHVDYMRYIEVEYMRYMEVDTQWVGSFV